MCIVVASAGAETTVSLTFEDGAANQYPLRSVLASHGMHGTFFVAGDKVGENSYYLSWAQIAGLAADGNEIGGKGLDLLDLTTLTDAEARHQVCDEHVLFADHGINASSFAYPNGHSTAATRAIVASCGYAA